MEGKDANLAHYDLEELEKYALVYLCEPEINNEKQGRELEEMISHLVQKGVNVIIEPTKTKNTPLFGVTTRDSRMPKEARLVREASGEELSDVENIDFIRNKGWIRELFGLDEVYYSLVSNEGRMKNNALGVKYIEGGKVYFVGMHLSQYLKATAIRNEGYQEGKKYPYAIPVKKLLSQLLEKMGANTDYSPGNFEVDKVQWNEKGVSFCYENEKETEVTLSLTYTPRWHGLIDGEELKVKEKEDLVVLKLPAGKHQVALNYGVTLYGYIGYGLSGLTLLLLLLYLKNFESWNQSLGLLGSKLGAYLEFKKEGEWKKNE